MKTLGVITGMGPLAGTYFLKRVLQLTPAKDEWEHFPMIAEFNTQIPSRTRSLLYNEESPAPEIIKTIGNLQLMGAEMVAIPCNSAHGWYDKVVKYTSLPWLNLIEVTSNAVKNSKVENVLILSAYVPFVKKLYNKYLDNIIYLENKEYEYLFKLIAEIKLDSNKKNIKNNFQKLLNHYKGKVDCVLLACTELSMLFDDHEKYWNEFRIIDSTEEYAKKCVELCSNQHK